MGCCWREEVLLTSLPKATSKIDWAGGKESRRREGKLFFSRNCSAALREIGPERRREGGREGGGRKEGQEGATRRGLGGHPE